VGMIHVLDRRLLVPIRLLLAQGLSPDRIALTLAVGVALAAFPVIGATTILCTLFALALGLNLPLIQAVNFLGAPLQLVCLLPFMRLGAWIFGGTGARLTPSDFVSLVASEPHRAIGVLWVSTWHAIGAWLLVAPASAAILFVVLRPVLREVSARLRFRRDAAGAA
jgi:uncharacterized protein (DUF2062 family)